MDAHGHGGIALLWRNEGGVEVISICCNYIDFEVNHEQLGRWRYTGYCGFLERGRRVESWNMMRSLAGTSSLPWCLIGDFNDIMTMGEKRGGSVHPRPLIDEFAEAIVDCGLVDLEFIVDIFTW